MPTLLVRLIIVRTIAKNNNEDVSPKNERLTITIFIALLSCNNFIMVLVPSSKEEVTPSATIAESVPNEETENKKSGDRIHVHLSNRAELLGKRKTCANAPIVIVVYSRYPRTRLEILYSEAMGINFKEI
jgi:hypothetical protein